MPSMYSAPDDSNYAALTGRIDLSPALDWSEFKDSPFFDADGAIGAGSGFDRSRQLKFDVREDADACACVLTKGPRPHTHFTRMAAGIVPIGEEGEPWYATNLVEDLQELVDTYPDRFFMGFIEVRPTLTTSLPWRLFVENGVPRMAKRAYPRLIWPSGVRSAMEEIAAEGSV